MSTTYTSSSGKSYRMGGGSSSSSKSSGGSSSKSKSSSSGSSSSYRYTPTPVNVANGKVYGSRVVKTSKGSKGQATTIKSVDTQGKTGYNQSAASIEAEQRRENEQRRSQTSGVIEQPIALAGSRQTGELNLNRAGLDITATPIQEKQTFTPSPTFTPPPNNTGLSGMFSYTEKINVNEGRMFAPPPKDRTGTQQVNIRAGKEYPSLQTAILPEKDQGPSKVWNPITGFSSIASRKILPSIIFDTIQKGKKSVAVAEEKTYQATGKKLASLKGFAKRSTETFMQTANLPLTEDLKQATSIGKFAKGSVGLTTGVIEETYEAPRRNPLKAGVAAAVAVVTTGGSAVAQGLGVGTKTLSTVGTIGGALYGTSAAVRIAAQPTPIKMGKQIGNIFSTEVAPFALGAGLTSASITGTKILLSPKPKVVKAGFVLKETGPRGEGKVSIGIRRGKEEFAFQSDLKTTAYGRVSKQDFTVTSSKGKQVAEGEILGLQPKKAIKIGDITKSDQAFFARIKQPGKSVRNIEGAISSQVSKPIKSDGISQAVSVGKEFNLKKYVSAKESLYVPGKRGFGGYLKKVSAFPVKNGKVIMTQPSFKRGSTSVSLLKQYKINMGGEESTLTVGDFVVGKPPKTSGKIKINVGGKVKKAFVSKKGQKGFSFEQSSTFKIPKPKSKPSNSINNILGEAGGVGKNILYPSFKPIVNIVPPIMFSPSRDRNNIILKQNNEINKISVSKIGEIIIGKQTSPIKDRVPPPDTVLDIVQTPIDKIKPPPPTPITITNITSINQIIPPVIPLISPPTRFKPPTPFILPPMFPGGGGGGSKRIGDSLGRTLRYQPSLIGVEKRIKRKQKGWLTGIEIRGL